MLPWILLALACDRKDRLPPDSGSEETEASPPTFLASLTLEGVENNDSGYLWIELAEMLSLEGEPELERCQEGGYEDPNPLKADAGDITVRVGSRLVGLNEGDSVVNLAEGYPAGDSIGLETDGGQDVPAFRVNELVMAPEPLVELQIRWEGDGLRFDWTSAGDDADTILLVKDGEHTVTCLVEDDGSFVISADDLAVFDTELDWGAVIRSQTREVVDGDVLVRGTARYLVLGFL